MSAARSLPSYPLPAAPVVVKRGHATALLPDSTVTLRFRGLPIGKLLELCDGRTPYAEVRKALAERVPPARLDRLVADLTAAGVLVDASNTAATWWHAVENPPRLGKTGATPAIPSRPPPGSRRDHTPMRFALRSLIERRHSVRSFAPRALPLRKIIALLWAMNGVVPGGERRSVPSAGAIYPLTIGLINLRAVPGLERGVFVARFARDGKVGLRRVAADAGQAARAFLDPAPLAHAQGAIVVLGDFAQTAAKYANRSVLLVTLEAGHAVQSALLAATGLGAGAVEIGGFFEDRIRELFRAPRRLAPLSTVVFGAQAPRRRNADAPPFSFEWLETGSGPYAPPFHTAWVEFPSHSGAALTCWGRSVDPMLAWRKAVAEAAERRACDQPQGLRAAKLDEVRGALDPRTLLSFTSRQYRAAGSPLRPFSPQRSYLWKDATDLLSGRRRAVPAELVYFRDSLPANAQRTACASANTSGVAAHGTRDLAIESALAELIERDAFLRAWLHGVTGAKLRPESLPARLAARLRALHAAGVDARLMLLRSEPAYVFLAFGQHAARCFTKVGTAAHADPEQALDQAMMEMEAAVAVQLAADRSPPIRPAEVRSPGDHGALYAQPAYYRAADFLVRSHRARDLPRRANRPGIEPLLGWARREGFAPLWVDLGRAETVAGTLHVARVVAPGLIPIGFGYARQPFDEGTLPHPFA